jgi:hypothetical protein
MRRFGPSIVVLTVVLAGMPKRAWAAEPKDRGMSRAQWRALAAPGRAARLAELEIAALDWPRSTP